MPSRVYDFLECEHLTALELKVARGALVRPRVANPQTELIQRKGDEHEAAYLRELEQQANVLTASRSAATTAIGIAHALRHRRRRR